MIFQKGVVGVGVKAFCWLGSEKSRGQDGAL